IERPVHDGDGDQDAIHRPRLSAGAFHRAPTLRPCRQSEKRRRARRPDSGGTMQNTFFPKSEYEDRWRRLEAEMVRRGYDTAVIWAKGSGAYERYGNVLWLTNYYSAHSG